MLWSTLSESLLAVGTGDVAGNDTDGLLAFRMHKAVITIAVNRRGVMPGFM